MTTTKRYSPEVRERAVNLVLETQHEHASQWKAIQSIAPKIGCMPETLRLWIKQHEQRLAVKNSLNADERQRLKELERENRELRRRPPLQEIASLTVPLMEQHGVEPVCQELHTAPATYYWQRKRQQSPELRSVRQRRDEELGPEIERVYDENKRLYGVKKVWLQLRREGIKVARCTVERLMRAMGLAGIRRGKGVKTTRSDKDAATPDDLVSRRFMAARPNQLWVVDFTYVRTAQCFVYVALIVDVFAGVIVGWRVLTSMETSLVLDALEQALWARRPGKGVIHHSDRGSQYVSSAYSKHQKDAEILASVGTTGDSYDNAMAESINGLYKTEVIHRGSWKNRTEVELASLDWVDWYNNRRLLGRLGYIPPTEAEMNYYALQLVSEEAA